MGWAENPLHMRYWGYLAGKLGVVAAVVYGMLMGLGRMWPSDPHASPLAPLRDGNQVLLCNLAYMVCFLIGAGVLYVVIWDQRYRCRVCLRRLRMPIQTGSWGRMLQFGRPRIEYICLYGHGTLREDELQISGMANPEWTPHSDDFWGELCASSKEAGQR
jgi:hypothetical protein